MSGWQLGWQNWSNHIPQIGDVFRLENSEVTSFVVFNHPHGLQGVISVAEYNFLKGPEIGKKINDAFCSVLLKNNVRYGRLLIKSKFRNLSNRRGFKTIQTLSNFLTMAIYDSLEYLCYVNHFVTLETGQFRNQ